ncbi:MAG: Asp-tRNA(Asn)/Glu-tRNA(Gln) amidotransferase GatCAB subunit B, partial [Acidobacteria bacterium]|nr:Asp-tRNA(Asn)/Glu-tRNA(Gln) amidotransferase GatCAB subunit B [Acidobacteriota bacterium]
ELARALKDSGVDIASSPLGPAALAGLIALIENGTISGSIAKGVFEKMFASGRTADEIVAAEGLIQITDEAQIARLVADVLAKHSDAVAQYRAGKTTTFGFLVGQVMKAAGGKANPKRVNDLLKRALEA